MKRSQILLTISFLILSLSAADTNSPGPDNFTPIKITQSGVDYIAFPLDQGIELLQAIKLQKINENIISAYSDQIEGYQEKEKLSRKQRIRQGVIVGVCATAAGFIIGGVTFARISR